VTLENERKATRKPKWSSRGRKCAAREAEGNAATDRAKERDREEIAEKRRRRAAAEASKLARNRARGAKAQERNRANDAGLLEENTASIKAD